MARVLPSLGEKKGRIQATHQFIRVGLHGPCGPYPATVIGTGGPPGGDIGDAS